MASAQRLQTVLFVSAQRLMLYKHNNHKTHISYSAADTHRCKEMVVKTVVASTHIHTYLEG